MSVSPRVVILNEHDSVGVCIDGARAGESLIALRGSRIVVAMDIPAGHKIALREHRIGEPVIKYGERIGVAFAHIPAGAHVHTHNVNSLRVRDAGLP